MQSQTNDNSPGVHGVDVAGLERQLAAAWREGAGGGESGATRVCVANLVVFSPGGEDQAELESLLEEVAAQTPSRVVVLRADCDAESRLDAYVSTHCHTGLKGRRQVCGEQVTIEAGGSACLTAASAVEPLLVPDIPAFLWWKDVPHYDDKLFARLVEMSDRVVIDSAAFDRPHADLRRVARLVAERRGLMRLSDLGWGRLTTWRSLVACFWDVPEYRPHLDALDSVVIEYVPPPLAPGEIAAQALLVVGWLASCLGWEAGGACAREGPGYRAALSRGGREIGLELRAGAGPFESAISRITLRCAGGAAEFYAGADEGGARLATSAKIGDAPRIGRVLAYEPRTEGRRLARELGILARDDVYEAALAAAARLTPEDDAAK
jgi:glucose-6-phosphate dehydrogenase assembly protein OpcA